MTKQEFKKIFKIAVAIYIASFFIFNWNDVSWIFNYRVVYGMVGDFFNPYPEIDAFEIQTLFFPNHSGDKSAQTKEFKTKYTDKLNVLEVPKLGIEVPIVFSSSTDKKAVTKDLDFGVVYYPGSVFPGQDGQIVVLGHSSPPGWPKIKYDGAFNDLDKLKPGDAIFIDLNNKQYTYRVKGNIVINKGADIPQGSISANVNTLILITCWPPGKDYQRMIVFAELVDSL